jgi:hypothetical protein
MADIKAQIAALEREYDEIRRRILAGEVSAIGDEWRVTVATVTRRSIAVADAQRLLPLEQTNVTLRRKQKPKPVKPPRRPFAAGWKGRARRFGSAAAYRLPT